MGVLGRAPRSGYDSGAGAPLSRPSMTHPIQPDNAARAPLGTPAKPPGGPPRPGAAQRSRIQLDSSLRRWFSRNLGLWRSRRTYYFPDDEVLRVDMLLRVEELSDPARGEAGYLFSWWPEQENGPFFELKPRYSSEGTMEAYLCGHQLQRNKGYLDGSPTRSQIRQVDEHEVAFESHYEDWDIQEHIRLIDQDQYRARSIYTWRHGQLELSEVHHEIRLEGAGGSGRRVA